MFKYGLPRRRTLVAALAVSATLATVMPAAANAQTHPRQTNANLVPGTGTYFGAYVRPSSGQTITGAVTELESQIGRKLAIHQEFVPPRHFMQNFIQWDIDNGRIPLIAFGSGMDMTQVAHGRYDNYFAQFADQVRNLHAPVFLRYAHEMDDHGNARWVHGPQTEIAAWRHVYNIFQQQGATNGVWVWNPTSYGFRNANGSQPAIRYYPGDAYVDWIGADAYNWGNCRRGFPFFWQSIQQNLQNWYSWAETKNKPLMVPEFGTSEDPANADAKAAWYAQAAQVFVNQMPDIRAVVYFYSNTARGCEWKATTSSTSLAGFKAMANKPGLQAGTH